MSQLADTVARLRTQVAAVCPIDGVSVGIIGQSSSVRIDFQAAATAPQRTAAQSAVDSFDWSAGAQSTFDVSQARTLAQAFLNDSNAEHVILRAVFLVALDEINILRAAVVRPILSISRVTTVATVTTYDPHGLTTGDTVRITGATLAAYNVLATVTVTSATTFTYAVAGSPTTPAVGPMSFTVGAQPAMPARTVAQFKTAVLAKITAGLAD